MSKLNAVKREKYFTRVRKRWKRRDVVEITEEHSKYLFTQYIRLGIREFLVRSKEYELELFEDDYKEIRVDDIHCDFNNVTIHFHSYAPNVFSYLRQMIGMPSAMYMDIVSPLEEDSCYLEFLSNSKSGQSFFLTNNKQLMIKTITKSEAEFFMRILNKYIDHFQHFPHSLLVKFIGLHSVKLKLLSKPIYFMVMLSIFYPGERIHHRYDIKACEIGRYTKPAEDNSMLVILKEKNLKDQKIKLGPQRDWFLKQIKHDTDFLLDIRVLDYSLLVGVQSLHQDEVKQNSDLASVIHRAQKSISKYQSIGIKGHRLSMRPKESADFPTPSASPVLCDGYECEASSLPGMVNVEDVAGRHSGTSTATVEAETGEIKPSKRKENYLTPPLLPNQAPLDQKSTSLMPSHGPDVDEAASVTSVKLTSSRDIFCRNSRVITGEEAILQNRRLLPDYRNELHVIDGDERYYLGMIDFFTRYTFKKKLENAYKRILYPPLSFSTVPPKVYAARFKKYWEDHTE